VIYVDVDPVAVEHSRAILAGNELTGVLQADMRDPDRILAEAKALRLLDFGEPVAVLLAGVLHFVPDADDPAAIVSTLRDAVVGGSYPPRRVGCSPGRRAPSRRRALLRAARAGPVGAHRRLPALTHARRGDGLA
jgi:hypothetical protein